MWRRKVQLIAGTSYSITLPKDWVTKNDIKSNDELMIEENNDRTLSISKTVVREKDIKNISLEVDNFEKDIEQILFSVYYIGVENINLVSKKEISKDLRMRIRKTLEYMSGTEISYEDNKSVHIRVLLDKSKIDITQILFRISLILDSSLSTLLEDNNPKEIKLNEGEIDRLYHLAAKMISSSLIDSNVLASSKIKSITLIPPFLMISKRLENVGDVINYLSKHINKTKTKLRKHENEMLLFGKREISRTISFLLKEQKNTFEKSPYIKIKLVKDEIKNIENKVISNYLADFVRYILDIEDEIVNLSFYRNLIEKKFI